MFLRCCLILFILHTARTSVFSNDEINEYSLWPGIHNGVRMMKIRKRDLQSELIPGVSEGDATASQSAQTDKKIPTDATNTVSTDKPATQPKTIPPVIPTISTPTVKEPNHSDDANTPTSQVIKNKIDPVVSQNGTSVKPVNTKDIEIKPEKTASNTGVETPVVKSVTEKPLSIESPNNVTTPVNGTMATDVSSQINPGVMKRGLIVFGGFALMAVAYYVFFKRKGKNNEANNSLNTNNTNQFRYGVLHNDEQRDNMELSRVPLTMDSEDDDDDLEVFDLSQKNKSLSYVNLQTHDDIDLNSPGHDDASLHRNSNEDLLLDIEDRHGDTLINWSSNGNKSIL